VIRDFSRASGASSRLLIPRVFVPRTRPGIRFEKDQVGPVGLAGTPSGITVREHSSLLPLTVGTRDLTVRVPQEVGRSDQRAGCPFPFSAGPFGCNGQLKTIQTENTTGSFDQLPSPPFSHGRVSSTGSSARRSSGFFVRVTGARSSRVRSDLLSVLNFSCKSRANRYSLRVESLGESQSGAEPRLAARTTDR